MDNLTHSLFALTLSRTRLGSMGRGTTAALLLASNAPDIDIVTLAGGTASYLKWHRGPTHGLLGVVGLGLASAGIAWALQRYLDRRQPFAATDQPATFPMLVAVSMIGVALHVLLDFPTSYGSRPLSPFDWHWFALDWMPIVDIYLLLVLVAGNVGFGQRSAAAKRRNAAIVLTIMAANYGLRGAAHQQALALVPRLFGPTLAPPCDPPGEDESAAIDTWPRRRPPTPPPPGKRCMVEVAAIPTFGSPFQWRIIAHLSNAFEIRDVDILDARFRADADHDADAPWRTTVRYPNNWTPAVMRAATTSLGQTFLGFSRFPAARSATDASGVTTVRWTDMRFAAATIAGDPPMRPAAMFTATVRLGADGRVVQETLGR